MMNKTRLLTLIALIITAVTAQAKDGLLWKVTGGNTIGPSYILGTHHLVPKSMIDSIYGLRDAISDVDAVYGEVANTADVLAETQAAMLKYGMAPQDSTLSKVLSPDDYAIIDSILTSYFHIPILKSLDMMKPMMVEIQFTSIQMADVTAKYGADGLFDFALMQEMQDKGKEVNGLESVDDQMRILMSAPISLQAKSLVETARRNDEMKALGNELTEIYMSQDLDALGKFMEANATGLDNDEAILTGRNRDWVDKLTAIFPERRVLVAVGSGHLPGTDGLISLLRARGYTVTPVTR